LFVKLVLFEIATSKVLKFATADGPINPIVLNNPANILP